MKIGLPSIDKNSPIAEGQDSKSSSHEIGMGELIMKSVYGLV